MFNRSIGVRISSIFGIGTSRHFRRVSLQTLQEDKELLQSVKFTESSYSCVCLPHK